MISTIEALKVKKSIQTLSDFLKIDDLTLIGLICLGDKVTFSKFKEASDVWNEFEDNK